MKKILCISLVTMLILGVSTVTTFAMPDRDSIFAPAPGNVSVGSDWTQFFVGDWPNVRVGMQDWAGNIMIPAIYSEIRNFENGFAVVADGSWEYLQWGMINTEGTVVIGLGELDARDLFAIQRLLALPADVALPANVEALHWNEVRRLLPARQYMEIFDIGTGITYTVRSFAHGNHADVETINTWNTQLHLYTFGGHQTWAGRPVWVTFSGRTFAAAIHSMQHDVSTIHNNDMDGHVCLHFYGSTNNFTNRDMYSGVIAESIRLSQLLGTANWLRSLSAYTPSPTGYTPQNYAPYQPLYYYSTTIFEEGPRIRIDGEFIYISADDQPPIIVDGRTLVPLRAVMEALGFGVYWDGKVQGALLLRDSDEILVQIDNINMSVNGSPFILDVTPRVINDRTMVPVRAISEATGMAVNWDGDNLIVDISTTLP